MQQLISAYLFQCKTCPLPGLGTLAITNGNVQSDFINKKLLAPTPKIYFDNKETPADTLVDFIAEKNNVTAMQAIEQLGNFCSSVKRQLNTDNTALINGVGNLYIDAAGNIQFNQAEIDTFFLPAVTTERVIHTEGVHNILVGDKETTSIQMGAYYDEPATPKNYWWVWVVAIAAVAIALILYYVNMPGSSPLFGNTVAL